MNTIEIDCLAEACVHVPSAALFGWYCKPQFRTLCTPPYARVAPLRILGQSNLNSHQMITENPHAHFARGGSLLRLSLIHGRNKELFSASLEDAKQEYASAHPRQAAVWQWLIPQRHRSLFRPHAPWATAHSSLTEVKEMLWRHSNRVNARFFDSSGSLYVVLYNGGFRIPNEVFNDGYYLPQSTVQRMVRASRMIPQDRSNLLLDWLHGQIDPWAETDWREQPQLSSQYRYPAFGASDTGSYRTPSELSYEIGIPGQSSRPASEVISDSSQMDVDS